MLFIVFVTPTGLYADTIKIGVSLGLTENYAVEAEIQKRGFLLWKNSRGTEFNKRLKDLANGVFSTSLWEYKSGFPGNNEFIETISGSMVKSPLTMRQLPTQEVRFLRMR